MGELLTAKMETMAGQNGQNSISPFFPGFQGIVATERA
jgi:hypothetical protein